MDAALYTILLVPPLSFACGSRCLTRLTLLFCCLPPTMIAFASDQMDPFWPRYWLLVGLVCNSCVRGWLRTAFIIWCAIPCTRNGTDVVFDLLPMRPLNQTHDPYIWLYTVAYRATGNSLITSFLSSYVPHDTAVA